MIRPPLPGVAFTEASDGDVRNDLSARASLSEVLGISKAWGTARQVHGRDTVQVVASGEQGEADALWTTVRGLPIAVFTADCFGVVLLAANAIGVAHAGWRGTEAGVAERLLEDMEGSGHPPVAAAIGPGIGRCCFEVGQEVAQLFPEGRATTTWGSTAVDLRQSLLMQLSGLETWVSEKCTYHDAGLFSHRRDATRQRMAAIGWVE